MRDATINYARGDTQISWLVPDFVIDFKHSNKGSVIRGFGKLGIGNKDEKVTPWKLRFQTQQSDKTQDLQLDLGFKEITSSSLRRLLPSVAILEHLNIPVSGKINAKLNNAGDLRSAFARIQLAPGRINFPWMSTRHGPDNLTLDIGQLKLAYTHKGNKLHILPSLFKWGKNQTVLSGIIEPDTTNGNTGKWKFSLKGEETRLAAGDLNLEPMIIDEWWIAGRFKPENDLLEIAGLTVRAGNAKIRLSGRIVDLQKSPGIYLDGRLSSISVPVLKRLWPSLAAAGARKWVGENILEGQVVAGRFKIAIPPGVIDKLSDKGDLAPEMVNLKLDLRSVVMKYLPDMLPLNVPDASLKITGRQLSVDVPKGRIYFPGGSALKILSWQLHDL